MVIFERDHVNKVNNVLWTSQDDNSLLKDLDSYEEYGVWKTKFYFMDDQKIINPIEGYRYFHDNISDILKEWTVGFISDNKIRLNHQDSGIDLTDNFELFNDICPGDKVLMFFNIGIVKFYVINLNSILIQDPDEEINEIYEHFRV